MLSLHLQFDTAEKDTELLYIYSYKIVILSLNLIYGLWKKREMWIVSVVRLISLKLLSTGKKKNFLKHALWII